MKAFRAFVTPILFAVLFVAPLLSAGMVTPAFADNHTDEAEINCEPRFFGAPPWYRGLVRQEGDECVILGPSTQEDGIQNYIFKIALNIVEIAVVIAGYIAFLFLLYGGFQFLTGGSNPSQIEKARQTMLNAIIGLAIALGAVGITNVIFTIIG